MPAIRIPLALAVLVTALLTWFAPASAGGPTSALLVVPGEGKTASLYYTDPEYEPLASLVGVGGDEVHRVDRSGRSHETGPGVTVTWMIHDVTPWRVDRIYLAGPGAPWIATQILGETGDPWGSPVWHQPEAPVRLERLLDRLGVGEAARQAGEFEGVAGAPMPAAAAPPPAEVEPETRAAATTESSGITRGAWGLAWGLIGAVVGVALSLLRPRARRRTAPGVVTGA